MFNVTNEKLLLASEKYRNTNNQECLEEFLNFYNKENKKLLEVFYKNYDSKQMSINNIAFGIADKLDVGFNVSATLMPIYDVDTDTTEYMLFLTFWKIKEEDIKFTIKY